jgi:hypothetical protein
VITGTAGTSSVCCVMPPVTTAALAQPSRHPNSVVTRRGQGAIWRCWRAKKVVSVTRSPSIGRRRGCDRIYCRSSGSAASACSMQAMRLPGLTCSMSCRKQLARRGVSGCWKAAPRWLCRTLIASVTCCRNG